MAEEQKPAGGAGGGAASGDGGKPADKQPLTFETFLEAQPEEVRGLIDGHTRGLKSALEAERAARKEQEKALREAARKAEKGSDAEKALTEAATQAKAAEGRAAFFVAAHSAGVSDLELAYLAAQRDGLLREDGTADLAALKQRHPALFVAPAGKPGAAAAGAGVRDTPRAGSMNDFIRSAIRGR